MTDGIVVIGVVGDTHVPDRIPAVPKNVFEVLVNEKVSQILHVGDISNPAILDEFSKIAPVTVVMGNRDIWYRANWHLPLKREFTIGGIRIGLTHGHGGFWSYIWEKVIYVLTGGSLERYIRIVPSYFPSKPDVIVFGHTHRPTKRWVDGQLIFNPGSLGPDYWAARGPVLGILEIKDGQVEARFVQIRPD